MRHTGPVTGREYPLRAGTMLVSTTDLKGRITYCNDAFVEASGYAREELLGKPHNLIRHPDVPAEAFRDLWATLHAGQPWCALVKNRRKDGDHYWVRASVTPVLEDGRAVGYMSVRTAPSRADVDAAEALFRTMRDEAARGRLETVLRGGRLRHAGLRGRLHALRHPGAGVRTFALVLAAPLLCIVAALAAGGGGAGPVAAAALLAGLPAAWAASRGALGPLEDATRTANRIASGQLDRLDAADADDAGSALRRGLAQMNVNLQALVGDVRHAVAEIRATSREIAGGNADLSQRTESQAGRLQQTAATLDRIALAIRETAGAAQEAAQQSGAAAVAAQRGETAAREAGQRMQAIRTSSARIAEITAFIDEIAFRTHLLAVNASVEAARAGPSGRGFAAVAAEVRALARRAATSSGQIKALIEESLQVVASGTRLVADAAETAQQTLASARRVDELIAAISTAASAQAADIGQVHGALGDLESLTQQNAAMVEELAASAGALDHRAQQVARTVGIFRTGTNAPA